MEIKYRAEIYKLLPNKDSVIAELGVAEGNFSRDMLNWPNVKKLYSIDLWETINGQKGDGGYEQEWHNANYNNAVRLLKPFGERSEILRGLTHEMSSHIEDESLDLLYIDADHSYKGVMNDLIAWFPKVKKGGYVSCHDYLMGHYGVNQAVKEFTSQNNIFEVLTIEENKPDDAGCIFKKPC